MIDPQMVSTFLMVAGKRPARFLLFDSVRFFVRITVRMATIQE